MKNYFEVAAKYDKENDKGQIKSVSEIYLFEAVNFGDAESLAHKELKEQISGEFDVKAVKQAKIAETLNDYTGGDFWFKAKVSFLDIDAKTGKEKTANELFLVKADNILQVYELLTIHLKAVLIPWRLVLISETKIKDVILLPV
jgi:hypothetical protein